MPALNVLGTALQAGVAPPVYLEATHPKSLERVSLEQLKEYGSVAARTPAW